MNALNNPKIKEAGLGWSRGKAIISKTIQRLDDGYFNHVYLKFILTNGMALIYESHLKGGVQITPYEHLLSAKTKGIVEDIEEVDFNISSEQAQLLWNDCLPLHGDGYDARQILIYYAWIRLLHRKDESRLFKLNNKKRFTCNEFVITAGRQVVDKLKDVDYSYTPEALFKLFHGGLPSKVMFGE